MSTINITYYKLFFIYFQFHSIPQNAIPCLNYKKALEVEEAAKQREKDSIFPIAKVESVEENNRNALLKPEEYREYCQKLFIFKKHTVKKFNSWAERRTHQRHERDQTIKRIKMSVQEHQRRKKMSNKVPNNEANNVNNQQSTELNTDNNQSVQSEQSKSKNSSNGIIENAKPVLPEGTKIISIPVFEMEQEAEENPLRQKILKKSKKDWVLNPAGKSTVCILHEYLQHSIKKAPEYKYQEMESSATPYR